MKHLRKFNESRWDDIPSDPGSTKREETTDRLRLGIKKYGFDSEFMKSYTSRCYQLKTLKSEMDAFFDEWDVPKSGTI